MQPNRPIFFLNIVLLLLVFSYRGFAQHQIITNKGDTLNCSQIDIYQELHEIQCYQLVSDSVLIINPDNVISIKYHFYPKYPNLKQPSLLIKGGIGISMSNYKKAFGNIETQPILADGLKRGTTYSVDVRFFNRSILGVATNASYTIFKNERDSTWAEEYIKTMGIGIAYCSKSVKNELFITGQAVLTYSDFCTNGQIPTRSFSGNNQLFGLQVGGTINYHITETVLFSLGGKLHIQNKEPHQTEKITNITPTLFEIGMGFSWFY